MTSEPVEGSATQRLGDKQNPTVADELPAHEQTKSSIKCPEASSPTSSAAERQPSQVQAVVPASASARANMRGAQLIRKRAAAAESVLTGDGVVATKYRNRNLVIVYYDSYVQSFFEDVVKFVSASRNMMRKAKMAAKVAQIKRLAELEMPDDDDESGLDDGLEFDNSAASFVPPQLSPSRIRAPQPDLAPSSLAETNGQNDSGTACAANEVNQHVVAVKSENSGAAAVLAAMSANRLSYTRADGNGADVASDKDIAPSSHKLSTPFRPSMGWSSSLSNYGAGSASLQAPDVLEELDKGLEVVQSLCEHAAHQFLRDGDCVDEIVKIKERMTGTKAAADKELERRLADDADGSLKKLLADGPAKGRMYRPQSMRRDASLAGAAARLKTSFVGNTTNGHNGANGVNGANGANGANGVKASPPAVSPSTKPGIPAHTGMGDAMMLEVDDDNDDADAASQPPKFEFRSTRAMGPRVVNGY